MSSFDYDLFVIGGGSGGVRAGRLAASLGKRVAIAEEFRFGGTCVVRGCVPKKLLVYASQFRDHFEDAAGYGWRAAEPAFDWGTLIENKDREISRLEGLYRAGLKSAGADLVESRATIAGPHEVHLASTGRIVTARNILIATGARPRMSDDLSGIEHVITSNEAFDLSCKPKSVVIIGGGYIAVEFAGIFNGLGIETTLVCRGAEILRGFDGDMRTGLRIAMEARGVRVLRDANLTGVFRRDDDGLDAKLSTGQTLVADQVMMATGRVPNTVGLGLEAAGVSVGPHGEVLVDDWSRTSIPSIYAIGDVTNRVQLTPAAIHEAICFVDTVFREKPAVPDHATIATAVFSQPEIGAVGLTEDEAAVRFERLDIFECSFRPMRNTVSGRQEKMIVKLVVNAEDRRVLGAHVLGHGAGEMAQLLGIAVKAGLTKDAFDATMAVHPTAAEELVTMYRPARSAGWGAARQGVAASS